MKVHKYNLILIIFLLGYFQSYAQGNLGDRLLGAAAGGLKALTFTNEDAAALSLQAITKLDAENPVAAKTDPYNIRLSRLFVKHVSEDGLRLNYRVYKLKDINAFAGADGSIRVFQGLMDIMDDNELLAVIGHEIGHVANQDSKDAIRASLGKQALLDAAASQSGRIAALTDSQLGQMGRVMWSNNHSRSQENAADAYSYDFMRRHGYNVNALESAFNLIAKGDNGGGSNIITTLFSSHPDSAERAATAKNRAIADGVYKPYVKIVTLVKVKAPVKAPVKAKVPVKKRPRKR